MKKPGKTKKDTRPRWDTGINGLDSGDMYILTAARFKVLSNPLRLRLIDAVARLQPVRPVDLGLVAGHVSSPFVIYNSLNILRRAGLVAKQGQVGSTVYYVLTVSGKHAARIAKEVAMLSETPS